MFESLSDRLSGIFDKLTGRGALSENDVNEALRLEPRHFGAWTGLGRILEELGARDEAIEAYREALNIHPTLQAARAAESRLMREQNGQGL